MNDTNFLLKPEEVEILYSNNVLICIDGSNLFNFLKTTRKYAANSKFLNCFINIKNRFTKNLI